MEIVYSDDFIKSTRLIPKPAQKKLAVLLKTLQKNPFNPKLHTKPLGLLVIGALFSLL